MCPENFSFRVPYCKQQLSSTSIVIYFSLIIPFVPFDTIGHHVWTGDSVVYHYICHFLCVCQSRLFMASAWFSH